MTPVPFTDADREEFARTAAIIRGGSGTDLLQYLHEDLWETTEGEDQESDGRELHHLGVLELAWFARRLDAEGRRQLLERLPGPEGAKVRTAMRRRDRAARRSAARIRSLLALLGGQPKEGKALVEQAGLHRLACTMAASRSHRLDSLNGLAAGSRAYLWTVRRFHSGEER